MARYIILVLLVVPLLSFSQGRIDTAAIIRQLDTIYANDQMPRKNNELQATMLYKDSVNQVQVEELISKYGWMGKSFVGVDGNITIFLVIQHADLATQEKYLPMFIRSVEEGESRLCDLALMQDRVLMRQGKPQIYGSQIVRNNKTGEWELYPVADEKNLNARRAKAGMEPIEKYVTYFGVEYKGPKE